MSVGKNAVEPLNDSIVPRQIFIHTYNTAALVLCSEAEYCTSDIVAVNEMNDVLPLFYVVGGGSILNNVCFQPSSSHECVLVVSELAHILYLFHLDNPTRVLVVAYPSSATHVHRMITLKISNLSGESHFIIFSALF